MTSPLEYMSDQVFAEELQRQIRERATAPLIICMRIDGAPGAPAEVNIVLYRNLEDYRLLRVTSNDILLTLEDFLLLAKRAIDETSHSSPSDVQAQGEHIRALGVGWYLMEISHSRDVQSSWAPTLLLD